MLLLLLLLLLDGGGADAAAEELLGHVGDGEGQGRHRGHHDGHDQRSVTQGREVLQRVLEKGGGLDDGRLKGVAERRKLNETNPNMINTS